MAIRLSGMVSGMDTEGMVKELMKAQSLRKTKLQNKITTTEWKQEKWKTLNAKLYSFYADTLTKIKMQGSFNTKSATSADETAATVTATTASSAGTHMLKIKQLASAQFVTGTQLTTGTAVSTSTKLTDLGMTAGADNFIVVKTASGEKSIGITESSTVGTLINDLKSAGLNASYDTVQKRFFISSKESGTANAFTISTAGTVDLSKLGLGTITKPEGSSTVSTTSGMTIVQPADAIFTYNNVEMTSSSNNVSVNGLNITLKSVTDGWGTVSEADDEVINLNVTNNTQAVYDMVKDFVSKYNTLLKEMNESYDAASARGYDPLTDEEKEAMTDDQVEKWENKIKDSLLRRDTNLSSIISSMRSNLGAVVAVDGKNYSLTSFGIKSANYTEKGLLHISGDKTDSVVAGEDDKLLKALNEDPDTVMTVITTLADNLYKSFTDNMKSSSLRSALTLYNDKELTKTVNDYKEDLSVLEKKLEQMESRYYKQFTAMEKAMSEMNSQSASLASMLGISQ